MQINRFVETPVQGAMLDLMWADPHPQFGSEKGSAFFADNSARGCSYFFTYAAACAFIKDNRLLTIIRGHEAQAYA